MEAISEKIRYSLSYRIRDTAGMGRRCPSEGSSLVIEDGRSTTPIPECTSILVAVSSNRPQNFTCKTWRSSITGPVIRSCIPKH